MRMISWASAVGVLFLSGLCASSVYALPFNQDMVGEQLITGKVMRQKPEGAVPVSGLSRQLPPRAEIIREWQNPLKDDPQAAERGKRLFEMQCTVCHGVIKGGQHVPSDLMLKGMPSINLLLSQPKFDPQKTDGFLWAYIYWGMDAIMPRYGYKLSDQEMWELVSYIRALQAENPL